MTQKSAIQSSLKKKLPLSATNKFKRTPFKSQPKFQPTKCIAQKQLCYRLNNEKMCLNDDIITCLDDETNDDDDDCIIIEPSLEDIVIDDDDDVPTTSRACMKKNTDVAMSSPFKNCHKLNEISHTQQKWEQGGNVAPITSLFFECFKTKSLQLNQKPIYSTELPKLLENTSAVKKDDIIVVNESVDMGRCLGSLKRNGRMDDSVIFVSESNGNNNYLPLVSNDVPNPITIREEPPRQASTRAPPLINKLKHSLFTTKEQKDLNAVNCNAYNPAAGNTNALTQIKKKRVVLIDGSNVAFAHSLKRDFSVEGLKICIDYFDKIGHDVKALVPMFRKNANKSTNPQLLDELQRLGKVIFTPCKNLPGLVSTSYDDRFIVQLACELDAAIISNDNYRDIIHESTAFKKLIENRVIGYTWCDDIFMLPKDPYGRFGPTLEEILNRL